MNNLKNDAYYIEKILTDLKFITKHISNVSKDEFEQNEVLLDSMLFRLIQVSENAKRMSAASCLTKNTYLLSCSLS